MRAAVARLGDVLAVLGIGFIGWSCLQRFNGGFDALAYHLPFAALRTGLLTPDQFVLPPLMHDRLDGFPPLADWVQGGLWRAFGRPEAAALISPLAVLLFALYARLAFGLGMLWSALIFLAVPILHTALDAMYVDLWSNAAFAVHLLAAFRLLTGRGRPGTDAATSMAALAVAVWSKPQFIIIGAASLALLLALLLRQLAWRPIAVCALLAPACFAWPLRDLILFGNPFWPEAVQLGPIALPGTQANVWDGPAELQHLPAATRWLLSQLDLDAVDLRPGGYTVDQGSKPLGATGNHMGGSLSVLLLTALVALGIGLRRVRPNRDALLAGAAMLLLTALVAVFPGGHELRYFSFVDILALFAPLCVLRAAARTGDAYVAGLRTGLQTLLVSSAIYVSFITGGTHLWARYQPRLRDIAAATALKAGLADHPDTVCDARGDFRGLLLSAALVPDPPGGARRVIEAFDCPAGALVIGPER